jgi:hypothetical protein
MIVNSIFLVVFFLLLSNVSGQQRADANDSVSIIVGRVKEMLLKHSNARLPVQNGQPMVDAEFQPIKFDGCDLNWRLVASLDKLKRRSLVVEIQLNIADLDSSELFVLRDFYHPEHWDVQLSTGKSAKMKMQHIILRGAKVTSKETFSYSQAGFAVDGQEVGEQIADALKMAIPKCVSKK